jgi:uncharacterized protein YggE
MAQDPSPRPAEDLARPYMYELAPEQVATQEPAFIEVTGNGAVEIAPDRAQADFAVETQADNAKEASAANAASMSGVVSALRALDLPGLTIETFGYALRPDYAYPTVEGVRTRVIEGYTALNHVRVTVDDVSAAGRIIDAAIGAGANRVASLAFLATDPSEARGRALSQAVEQARQEAETIARALGRELGAPLEVRGGAQSPTPRRDTGPQMMELAARAVETPIEAGGQTVRASVTIRFLLGPPRGRR